MGPKDKAPAVQRRDNHYPALNALQRTYTVLYDMASHRAWLTNGLHTLVHLLRASFKVDQDSAFGGDCLFNPACLNEPLDPANPRAAVEFLRDCRNLEQPIFPNLDEVYEEETTVNGISTRSQHRSSSLFRMKHRINQLVHVLEQLIDHQARASSNSAPGISLKLTPRSQLEGYRFMDIAAGRTPLPRVANLQMFRGGGKSWVDFIRQIHAITLFGEGFGELLTPAPGGEPPCVHWETLTEGRDYLAVAGFDLERIIRENGSAASTPLKLAPGIFWHKPGALFEACACKGKAAPSMFGVAMQRSCDRVQVLLPGPKPGPSSIHVWGRQLPGMHVQQPSPPLKLQAEGAVIFGRSETFPWRWPESGDPQQEAAAASAQSDEMDLTGSGVGGTSSTETQSLTSPGSSQSVAWTLGASAATSATSNEPVGSTNPGDSVGGGPAVNMTAPVAASERGTSRKRILQLWDTKSRRLRQRTKK